MLLYEVFDQPYQWEYVERDPMFFEAAFTVTDGSKYYVYGQDKGSISPEWNIGFYRVESGNSTHNYKITNTGDQQRIFATVIDVLREFIGAVNQNGIKTFYFEAKEPSRLRLYKRLVATLLPSWKTDVEDNIIKVVNPKYQMSRYD